MSENIGVHASEADVMDCDTLGIQPRSCCTPHIFLLTLVVPSFSDPGPSEIGFVQRG